MRRRRLRSREARIPFSKHPGDVKKKGVRAHCSRLRLSAYPAMSEPRHLLALDQGTTSSRTIVFDFSGRQIAVAQQEFKQHYPRPGWVEHDAAEIWATQRATME